VIGTDCTGICKSNYHMITPTTAADCYDITEILLKVALNTTAYVLSYIILLSNYYFPFN